MGCGGRGSRRPRSPRRAATQSTFAPSPSGYFFTKFGKIKIASKIYRVNHPLADLGWVDFGMFHPSCPTAQPILPNSHLPKQNGTESGTTKIRDIPTQVREVMVHPVRADTMYCPKYIQNADQNPSKNQDLSKFRNGDGIDVCNSGTAASAAVFRFATYEVRERLTATRTLLGSAKLSVADLVASGNEDYH